MEGLDECGTGGAQPDPQSAVPGGGTCGSGLILFFNCGARLYLLRNDYISRTS
jgi:hypothetical protein